MRTVFFSQGGLRGGAGKLSLSAASIPMFLLAGTVASLAVFFGLGRFPWIPAAVRAAVLVVCFFAIFGLLVRLAVRGYRRVTSSLKLPMEMDPGADLNVICRPDQVARMQNLMPAPGDGGAFEPEIFRVWISSRRPFAVRILTPRGKALEMVWIALLVVGIQAIVQAASSRWVRWEVLVGVVGLLLCAPFVKAFVFPAYLRVAPGVIDVVRFKPGRPTPQVERVSLRDRPVRLDMKRKELLVGSWHPSHPSPEVDPEPAGLSSSVFLSHGSQADLGSLAQLTQLRIIPLWGAFAIGALERTVFRAATASVEPGPMPGDALI